METPNMDRLAAIASAALVRLLIAAPLLAQNAELSGLISIPARYGKMRKWPSEGWKRV